MVTKRNTNKTLIQIFTKNILVILAVFSLVIAFSFSFLSYNGFVQSSKNQKEEYIKSQRELIKREVVNVEKIIQYERSKLDEKIRTNIKTRVDESHAIATNIYNKFKNNKPKHEIVLIIKEALRQYRFFEKRGYIFILDLKGTNVLNSNDPGLEGKNLIDIVDSDGVKLIQNAINIINDKGEGFNAYKWPKPNESGTFDKLSYLKHFKPYDWMIGTGDYVIEVERQIKKEVLDRIGQMRYDSHGYIFVVDFDGTVQMNQGQPSIIGKNIIDVKDPNGVYVAKEIIKLAKDPNWDGFFNYSWQKFLSKTISPKLAYHKTVPDWEWYYGTGVYLDDIELEIEKKQNELKWNVLVQLLVIFFVTALCTVSLYFIVKKHAGKLNEDLEKILVFFNSLTLNSKQLEIKDFKYAEFKQLGRASNKLLEKLQSSEKERFEYERQVHQTQKMNALTQLIGGVAHDFNNLLGAVLGYSELLQLRLKGQPKLEKFAEHIIVSGHRGQKLIKKLLSFVKKDSENKEVVNICALLKDEEEFIKNSLTAKIYFKVECNIEQPSLVLIDKSDFQDVILNICINAMHAMSSGQQDSKILISINGLHLSEYEVPELAAGDYVKIAITDNGVGMEPETVKHVFEPFYTTSQDGTGLGLSQVYNFCKRNDGMVTVTSELGIGTTFFIFLPKTDVKAETEVTKDNKIPININRQKTILVVDDEKVMRDLCVESLMGAGYKILEAKDGVEALSVLANNEVDLLLSDIIMPYMDGHILVEKVTDLYPELPIQLMSGYIENENIPDTKPDIYQNIIDKPFSPAAMVKQVDELLQKKR